MGNLEKQVYVYTISTMDLMTNDEKVVRGIQSDYEKYLYFKRREKKLKTKIDNGKVDEKSLEEVKEKLEKAIRRKNEIHNKLDLSNNKLTQNILKQNVKKEIKRNESDRVLNPESLTDNKKTALFESTLTRVLGMKSKEVSTDIIMVNFYHHGIMEQILEKGFYYQGEHWQYLSSSAGQIRKERGMFVNSKLYKEKEMQLTAGLTEEVINDKGGMSPNKYLAYLSLVNSASEVWEQFHKENLIDHTIVVDDVEVLLKNKSVDYIDRNNGLQINKDVKRDIPLETTDGAGMCLPEISKKNFQYRLIWQKGLISPFDFKSFVKQYGETSKVKDIYGKEWDIIDDDIKLILFKSQFKMWKFYDTQDVDGYGDNDGWEYYKDCFKKYNCEATFMNVEEDEFNSAKTTYQTIQQLVDLSEGDLSYLTNKTNDTVEKLSYDTETMLDLLNAGTEPRNNYFQRALSLYPELLQDPHTRKSIRNRKKSIVEQAKGGKLELEDGYYTYVIPDWFMVCQSLFTSINEPAGLLAENEVYCDLFPEGEIDTLRNPSLSFEHVIQNNIKGGERDKWFITKGIYISSWSILPKIVQADFDGDCLLTLNSPQIISMVKRNQKLLDVRPLDYEMGVAEPAYINAETKYKSLKAAFTANIGEISNAITKEFNRDLKEIDYSFVKKLTSYSNYLIDYAKTLDMPEGIENLKKEIGKIKREKVPYFFSWNKTKVDEYGNRKPVNTKGRTNSVVNRIEDYIINPRIHFSFDLDKFNWKNLMSKPYITNNTPIIDWETDKKIVDKYIDLDQSKHEELMNLGQTKDKREAKKHTLAVYLDIREELISVYPEKPELVTDVLVRYLFKECASEYKTTLWESLGDYIVINIRKNVHNKIRCADCHVIVNDPGQRQLRCGECQKDYKKKMDKLRLQVKRAEKKNSNSVA